MRLWEQNARLTEGLGTAEELIEAQGNAFWLLQAISLRLTLRCGIPQDDAPFNPPIPSKPVEYTGSNSHGLNGSD